MADSDGQQPLSGQPGAAADRGYRTAADQEARGKEAVHRYFLWLWDCYPELTFRLENVVVNGGCAAAEVTYTGGPAGSGARCFVLHVRGELIRRIRCY